MKRFLIVFILLAFVGSALADGIEDQVRIFSFVDKLLTGKTYMRMQFVFGNIVASREPLLYLGPKIQFSEEFSFAVMFGKKFIKEGEDYKFVLSPTFDNEKWFFCSQVDFNISNKNVWQIIQVRRFLSKEQDLWVGVESENIYGGKEDRYYSVGPCIGIRMSEKVCINTTFFWKWIYQRNFNVIRFYLILDLN